MGEKKVVRSPHFILVDVTIKTWFWPGWVWVDGGGMSFLTTCPCSLNYIKPLMYLVVFVCVCACVDIGLYFRIESNRIFSKNIFIE